MDMIYYKKKKHYKYKMHSEYRYDTGMAVGNPVDLGFLGIDKDGGLVIREGYTWDGPSGPTIDTRNFMRGSLVHDALYQLIREGLLPRNSEIRKRADEILKEICIEDGMWTVRAAWVYLAVRIFGRWSVKPDMLSAPAGAPPLPSPAASQ